MLRRRSVLLLAPVLAVVFGAAGLAVAAPASAHTEVTDTSPDDGKRVDAPSEVVITLSQAALAVGTEISVVGPAGEVGAGQVRLVDRTVRQSLAPDLPSGKYEVKYRITSADGHPVTGEFDFRAAAAAVTTPTETSPTASATDDATATATVTPEATPSESALVGGIPAERVSADQGDDDTTVKIGAAVVVVAALAVLGAAVVNRRRAPKG